MLPATNGRNTMAKYSMKQRQKIVLDLIAPVRGLLPQMGSICDLLEAELPGEFTDDEIDAGLKITADPEYRRLLEGVPKIEDWGTAAVEAIVDDLNKRYAREYAISNAAGERIVVKHEDRIRELANAI